MIEKKYKQVDNITTGYIHEGGGLKIMMLHGWRGNTNEWLPNIKELVRDYECLAIDLPGFGETPPPNSPWEINNYSQFTRSFVKSLGWERFYLIGKSFGGRIAIKYALQFPEDLSGLILVDAAGIEKKSRAVKTKILAAKFGKAITQFLPQPLKSEAKRVFYKALKIESEENPLMQKIKGLVTTEDLSAILRQISVPTIVMWGSHDEILPPATGRQMASQIENAEFKLIKNAGHDAHSEKPDVFNELVSNFIKNPEK